MGKQGSKLAPSELQRLSKLTYFDKKELKKWYKQFIQDCPSGQVDKEQFCSIYQQFFPFGDCQPFSELLFAMYDSDKSGTIDFSEYMLALSISTRGKVDERLRWAFQLYDIDHDGFISRNEMLTIVDAIYLMVGKMSTLPSDELTPQQRVDKIFQLLDTNNDGQLSMDEFCQGSLNDPTIFKALTIYDGLV